MKKNYVIFVLSRGAFGLPACDNRRACSADRLSTAIAYRARIIPGNPEGSILQHVHTEDSGTGRPFYRGNTPATAEARQIGKRMDAGFQD